MHKKGIEVVKKEIKIHSVKYNFIMNFILSASNFLFPLITFPYISRILGASGNGVISFASSITNYFVMIASLGIPTYGIRACARVRDNKDRLSKTVQELLIINSVTTILSIITFISCIFFVPKFAEEKVLFLINGLTILLNMFGVNWFYQALEQYDYITIRSIIFKAASVLFMFLLVHSSNDYIIYGAITVLANVGSNILNFIRLRMFINVKKYNNYEFAIHLKPIFVLFAQSLVTSIYINLDTAMLGFMTSDYEVGLYSAAVKLKSVLLALVQSLGNVLLPRMSYYAKNDMEEEYRKTMSESLIFTCLLSFPLAVFFSICSKDILLFLAGNEYIGATLAMIFTTIAIVPIGITGILGIQVLISKGREDQVLYSVTIGAIIDVILNWILIPKYGATGAAFATMIAEFGVLAYQIFAVKLLMYKKIFDLKTIIKSLISCILPIMVVLLISNYITNLFLRLFLSAAGYFAIYSLFVLLSRIELVDRYKNIIFTKIYRH